MIYRDRIVFQAQVFDANVGTNDGDGIESVQFISLNRHAVGKADAIGHAAFGAPSFC